MSATNQANQQQREASDPNISAFVAASAGSGKTKLLTDRLLRLMLAGSAPEKILCLTYTKAAAAEMRIRLNQRLGAWVTMPDASLSQTLQALDITPDAKTLSRARQLFADVLDLPGGMRIETIHAFCQSLLRRFPLEARLSPHFSVADDHNASKRLKTAREQVLTNGMVQKAIKTIAAEMDEQRFAAVSSQFVQTAEAKLLQQKPEFLTDFLQNLLKVAADDEQDLQNAFAIVPDVVLLKTHLKKVAEAGTPTGQGWARTGLEWLKLTAEQRLAQKELWISTLFTKSGDIRSLKGYFGKLKEQSDQIRADFIKEAERVYWIEEKLKCLKLVQINQAFFEVLSLIAKADHDAKAMAAELSYTDLIAQTSKLLIDPGSAWVLYKLDGGIEHLLLDEVQDTAPEQWKIANQIAAEFFAGLGAREQNRSIFAVGDPKQSIFSFQGADLKSFEKYRDKFKFSAVNAKRLWRDGKLSVSFRSTAPILALTDAVFAQGDAREGVLTPGDVLRHDVSRVGQAGSAILWPLTQNTDPPELPTWDTPDDYQVAESSIVALARRLTDYIAQRLTQPLLSKNRMAQPGDFLVLVRTRGPIVTALTSELKARSIDVAGLDRITLPEQAAVSDLLALCDALLLPEDDLAFAQFLVSPLGGLSDESLMELAMNRKGVLVAALYERAAEQPAWSAAKDFYDTLRKRVDFDTPFALLSQALGALGGRAKLLLRFGAEASEPLDELLSEALSYTLKEPASLQNFVHYLRASGQEIKRETESGSNEVRIMTVHGAKGLQAPIVILPDTTSLPKAEVGLLWLDHTQEDLKIPIVFPHAQARVAALQPHHVQLRQTQIEEYNRLLYVALTRAEDEILICGAKGKREISEYCWYESVKSGFLQLGAEKLEDGSLVYACSQTTKPDGESKLVQKKTFDLPGWVGCAPDWQSIPPVKDQTRPERIIPSRAVEDTTSAAWAASPLAGMKGAASMRAASMARGTAVHALLQHLPTLPSVEREQAALAYLAAQPDLAAQRVQICASVLKILHDPALEKLFSEGSGAEIALAGIVDEREISGEADRVFVGEEEIIVADFKSDKNPPADLSLIPEKYIFQLAAYRAVLRQIYPGRRIECVLIWTDKALVMTLPDALLSKAGLG